MNKIDELKNQGKTIVIVSHDLSVIKNLCSRGLLLKNGKTIIEGSVAQILDQYLKT
jgi:ABC-type polysaccharide/polyol phosphate transport system ATPase subunit